MVIEHTSSDDYFVLETAGYILIREHILLVVCYLYTFHDWPFVVAIELSTV